MKNRARAIVFLAMILIPSGALGQDTSVTILGAVRRPGTYMFSKGERLSSLLVRAGGIADNAWLGGAVLSRESAMAQKERLLHDLISRIEREVFAKPGEEEQKREFIETLAKLRPGKLVSVRLAHPRLLKGSEDDLPLEEGDALYVLSKTDTVTVIGAVKMPGTGSPCPPKTDPKDCIRRAGGFAENADREHVYRLKADGTAHSLSRKWIRWNPKESRWEMPAFLEPAPSVEPGDTVVVPRKPVRSTWALVIRDLPQLLMEIHALTGVQVDPP